MNAKIYPLVAPIKIFFVCFPFVFSTSKILTYIIWRVYKNQINRLVWNLFKYLQSITMVDTSIFVRK